MAIGSTYANAILHLTFSSRFSVDKLTVLLPPLLLLRKSKPPLAILSSYFNSALSLSLSLSLSSNHHRKYHLSSFQRKTFSSMASMQQPNFQDFLPLMTEKLGGDGLLAELCNGFRLLMDSEKGVITFDSLKNNSAFLGLQELSDDDLYSMLKEGDFDGDGALNQMEFCGTEPGLPITGTETAPIHRETLEEGEEGGRLDCINFQHERTKGK